MAIDKLSMNRCVSVWLNFGGGDGVWWWYDGGGSWLGGKIVRGNGFLNMNFDRFLMCFGCLLV